MCKCKTWKIIATAIYIKIIRHKTNKRDDAAKDWLRGCDFPDGTWLGSRELGQCYNIDGLDPAATVRLKY